MPSNPYDPPQVREALPESGEPKLTRREIIEAIGYTILFFAVFALLIIVARYFTSSGTIG